VGVTNILNRTAAANGKVVRTGTVLRSEPTNVLLTILQLT
jgi:hypothetical protein